jgi:hypothetical protein
VDSNGKWPTRVHNAIITAAFPELSPIEVRAILSGNAAVDNLATGHLSSNAYMHGMRASWEDPEQARNKTDAFIAHYEARAKNFAASGHWTQALNQFGIMQHPIIDRLSPAHAGEQVWLGSEILIFGVQAAVAFAASAATHHVAEGGPISQKEFEAAVKAERQRYLRPSVSTSSRRPQVAVLWTAVPLNFRIG